MEIEDKPLDDNIVLNEEPLPKIYSKNAIWGFSIFFTTIFGGVLLMQNLRDIGNKKEANHVLIFSILFTILVMAVVNSLPSPNSAITLLCNGIGALILNEYFFKRNFPTSNKYEYKKIWKPLIISIIISIPFVWAAIYTAANS